MTKIYKCKSCEKIHLETGNVLIHFPSLQRLQKYMDYLETIDGEYFAAINRKKGLSKDIFLPVEDSTVNIAFSLDEFEDLKKAIRNYLSDDGKSSVRYMGLNKFTVIHWN